MLIKRLIRRGLRKVGFRDSDWGDWRGLNSQNQLPRYHFIEYLRTEYKPRGSVLDVGSGEGIVLDMIHKSSSSGVIYCGIEQSRKAIKIAGSKISNPEVERFLRGDIRDLCLINGESFDLILFNEVLYYLPNPQRDSVELMREYRDHLKEGGLFLVSIWHNSVAPREKNDITWQAVNEVYSGDSCLINAYIRKDDNSGWRIALYSPKR